MELNNNNNNKSNVTTTVVVMLGPLYFDPAAGRAGVISVRITEPDELDTVLSEYSGSGKVDDDDSFSINNLHIVTLSSSIASLYDDCILQTFLGALRPGGEVNVHALAGSEFSPVQEADVDEIRYSLEKNQDQLIIKHDKSSEDNDGSWVMKATKKKDAGAINNIMEDHYHGGLSSGIEYPFGTIPKDLEGVAEFIKSEKCQRILILAGAGMSVNAGIPDFRSAGGLYDTLRPKDLTCDEHHRQAIEQDPTYALNFNLFVNNQLPLLEVNRKFMLGIHEQEWKATLAHRFVELLHTKIGKLVRLYTQNIDGLEHQCPQLPNDKVIRVHGTMDEVKCVRCDNPVDFSNFCDDVRSQIKDITGKDPNAPAESNPIPCAACGNNSVKPTVVSFGETLPDSFFENIGPDTEDVDMLIVIGTSLKVAPANLMVVRVPETAMRLLVNRDPVGQELGLDFSNEGISQRDYFAGGNCDEVLLELMRHLGRLEELEPLRVDQKLPSASAALLEKALET